MKFNLNECVKVKLTDVGIEVLRQRHFKMYCNLRMVAPPFKPPTVDDDGYTRFQLWNLMELFGDHVGLLKPPPFYNTIIIEGGSS